MDYDGANHRFLTNGQWTVLTPRFAPNQQTITFMTYQDERPRVMVYELDIGPDPAAGHRPLHDLRAALLARQPLHHLLDGGERQYRHLPDPGRAAARRSG